jgi:predicted acyltransferase
MRLNSLDILRGMTMLGMILVDNAGPYPPWFIDHAEWNGLTPADLIFPSFVFIMGMAVPLAMNKNNPVKIRNIIRILALFGIGVFLNLSARKFTFNHCNIC